MNTLYILAYSFMVSIGITTLLLALLLVNKENKNPNMFKVAIGSVIYLILYFGSFAIVVTS